jgi:phosphotransferase system HPr (HPr) family protein
MNANGKSIMSVMLLAAEPESEIELLAEGPQANEAVDALDELFKARFHEDDA